MAATAGLLLVAATLLFWRLGHYGFWCDEAQTALAAKGILRTGDTSAVVDHNVVAYRGGILLKDLHERSTPPLPAYVTALVMAVAGEDTGWLRFPFALCGLVCVGLLIRWLWRLRADKPTWLLMSLAILGNVAFLLYCRQCRYYAPAILASLGIVYVYLNWDGRRRTLGGWRCYRWCFWDAITSTSWCSTSVWPWTTGCGGGITSG